MTTRADVVRVVRSFLLTPFGHRGRAPGIRLDCAGVPICAARQLGLVEPDFDLPPYTMSAQGRAFMELANHHLLPIDKASMQAGDVIAFIPDAEPQHLGILVPYVHGGLAFVHACNAPEHMKVIETRLVLTIQKFAAAFALPGID